VRVILVGVGVVFFGGCGWVGVVLVGGCGVLVVVYDYDVSEILERELFATIPGWEDLK
jgi:hypothetical protein